MQSLSRVKAQRLRELASNALAQHKYSEAIAHLNAAVWLCQGNADLYEMCAQAYVGLCDVHSALLNYSRALKLTPTDGKENACNDEQRRAEALAHLLDVRAVAMLEEGSFSLALTLLSEAVTLSPRESSFRLHRAIALSCLEQYGEALQDLDACINSHPPSADVHYLRAKLHLMRKELSAARRAVDAAVELEPNHAASKELLDTMVDSSEVYAEEATKLMLLGQPEDATLNLTHAMQLQPRKPELRVRRAAALRQQGKLQEAILDLERAISDSTCSFSGATSMLIQTYNDLGVRLASQQLCADAIRWFDRAIDLDDTDSAFFLNRADCHQTLGNTAEALSDLEQAHNLSAHDPQTQWNIRTRLAMVHNQRGTQLFNFSDPRRAAVEFSRAIECNPKIARFYTNRADAMMMLNGFTSARDDLLAALQLNPNESRARELLDSMCPS